MYDSQGNAVSYNAGLTGGSDSTSIEVNTDYVTGVGIQAGLGSSAAADKASIVSASVALKVVPERLWSHEPVGRRSPVPAPSQERSLMR